jgi:hypothetical protein
MRCVGDSALSPIMKEKTTFRSGFFFNSMLQANTLVYDAWIGHSLLNS